MLTAVLVGCETNATGPQIDDIYIEIEVGGGIAGVGYTYAIVGRSTELRGVACVSHCDFDPGERLADLTPAQVAYLAGLFEGAGILALNGTDFGTECCDRFHYRVSYRDGRLRAEVRGGDGRLPIDLSRAIEETLAVRAGVLPLLIDWESRPESWPQDPLVVRDVSLDGSILSLDVEYGGGCDAHDHDLVAWGGWLESFPVQVNVLLTHEDHGDPCDALVMRELRFDLSRLEEEYLRSYPTGGPGPITIVLRLVAPDGQGALLIDYTF